MTCIVAIGNGETVWMGSDAIRHSDRDQVARLTEPKIFLREFGKAQILIGVSGLMLIQQVIQKQWTPDEALFTDPDDTSDEAMWNIRTHLWDFLHRHPHDRVICEGDARIQGEIIFGWGGWVWSMNSDGGLGKHEANYHAIGSGNEFALGSLYTTHDPEMVSSIGMNHRIKVALEAAAWNLSSIQGPFTYLKV